jgi:hypothetical protein
MEDNGGRPQNSFAAVLRSDLLDEILCESHGLVLLAENCGTIAIRRFGGRESAFYRGIDDPSGSRRWFLQGSDL